MRCRTSFSFTNRKHHCRNCGNVFCGACSSKSIPLPHLGIAQPVRVDDGCHAKLIERDRSLPALRSRDIGQQQKTLFQGSLAPREAMADTSFDADLKRALEMSLEETEAQSNGSVFVPQSRVQPGSKSARSNGENSQTTQSRLKDDDDDMDLKAAIAASLNDMEEQKRQHARTLKSQSPSSNGLQAQPRRSDIELSLPEAENINLFSTLVDRLQHQAPGTILREPQIQELYDSIGTLRPKLARTFGETMSKHGMYTLRSGLGFNLIEFRHLA